jgi:hypothetical protein
VHHVAFCRLALDALTAGYIGCCFAGSGERAQAVRAVLLQLLCDAQAVYAAFHAALGRLTADPEFEALAARGDGGAVDVAGNVVPERQLGEVAEELRAGLLVGAGSALERILQVSGLACLDILMRRSREHVLVCNFCSLVHCFSASACEHIVSRA